jgi:pyruvate formate lyase activating enzyme
MRGTPAAEALRIGGLQPFTSIDYPGALAAVVFVQGCAWRCAYCHNPHLQARDTPPPGPPWGELRAWLVRRRGLLDAVVFSGGEPTLDPALPAALREVRALGFRVGLHSAGMAPRRLQALLPHLDWVGLDVKAPLDDPVLHDRITGVRGAADRVRASLRALVASGVAHECRTTVHASLLAGDALVRLVDQLAEAQVQRGVLQACRSGDGPAEVPWPAPAVLAALQQRWPRLALRPTA